MSGAPLRNFDTRPAALDVAALRREFPVFDAHPELVFLDSGASAQKPRSVIDGVAEFYRSEYANVHRGVYALSARSTDRFEEAREKVRAFLAWVAPGFGPDGSRTPSLYEQSFGTESLTVAVLVDAGAQSETRVRNLVRWTEAELTAQHAEHEAELFCIAAATPSGLWRPAATPMSEANFTPLWAGQAAGLCRELPAGELTRRLAGDALRRLAAGQRV